MKEFLFGLANGIRNIPRKYQNIYEELKNKGFIQEKQGNYQIKEGFVIGSVDISRSGRGFLRSFLSTDHKDLLIDGLSKSISQNDIVLVKPTRIKGRVRAKIILSLHAENPGILCYLEKVKGEIIAFELKNPHAKPIRLTVSQKSLRELPRHCLLKVDMRSKEIKEVLGSIDDPQIDENISLTLYNRDADFTPEACVLADSFGEGVDVDMYHDRKDLRTFPFCTIDPNDAKDHDDAIYFHTPSNTLYVAIADVSEYVSSESALDVQAKNRGFSVYFPHKSFPMLPRNLSENICSLKEGKDRLAFVWRLRLHRRTFEVIDSELFEAFINNHQNITYADVDKLLSGKKISINKEVKRSILDFYPIAKKLRSKRLKKGYEFFNDEIKMELNQEGLLTEIKIDLQSDSHMIVEEAMLLANRESARFLNQHLGDNGIYRVHNAPTQDRLNELLFECKALGYTLPSLPYNQENLHSIISSIQKQATKKDMRKQIDKMIIRSQSQASYSPYNIGHFGLGFDKYTHFTSPIRRYSDLLLHRILKQIISNSPQSEKKLSYLLSHIKTSCMLLSDQERQVFKIEVDFKDRKYSRWALDHIGTVVTGIIADESYPPLANAIDCIYGARITLDCLSDDVKKFDEVKMQILDAHIPSGKIFAKIINKPIKKRAKDV
ncbi:RNB domain-containing ribonuclease [Helicobacter cappadocius]|uniref:Ribonuclease R n=1 Tax=Helicobacter cappadocius TaxID=3063998 RepID=A0AA90T9I7_9HELI|nr:MULTISPECIES: ribonuclease R family protein [unclassified Helicobacter]MDO7252854.1 ribonuclease R [Helicobacter sp. faydin-H75]MDP2538897.1 ribonuclease R [Helicobacter sp. faydin-H76]